MRRGRLRERVERFRQRTRETGGRNIYDGVHDGASDVKSLVDKGVDLFDTHSGAKSQKQGYLILALAAVLIFFITKKRG